MVRLSIALVVLAACSDPAPVDDTDISVTPEPAGTNCANGGQKIVVTNAGVETTSYVCNGDLPDQTSVTVTDEPPGANCEAGGKKIETTSGTEMTTSYVCNGSSLVWSVVTQDTQAVKNYGYISTATTPITLTLPANANLAIGDELGVRVQGNGPVSIKPSSGQSFQHSPDVHEWVSIAAGPQSSGRYVVAQNPDHQAILTNTGVYVSHNRGTTWTFTSVAASSLVAIAMSADGSKIAVGDYTNNDGIFISSDGGATFTVSTAPTGHPYFWTTMAMSADGQTIYANCNYWDTGVWVSRDGGATWDDTTAPISDAAYRTVKTSSNGATVIALAYDSTQITKIWISTDAGVTWNERTPAVAGSDWYWATVSADGSTIYAAGSLDRTYRSDDGGLNWVALASSGRGEVATSGNGDIVAASFDGYWISISTDRGVTWRTSTSPSGQYWDYVYMNAAGDTMHAFGNNRVFERRPTGSLVARKAAAVDLIYTGSGSFFVESAFGSVQAP